MGGRGTLGGRIIVGGGIGAGKSSVLDALSDCGFFVVQADRIGHDVLDHDRTARNAVAERWPSVVVDGQLSRPAIAAIVFNDDAELRALEAITHPAIAAEINTIVENMGDANVAVEIPVMGLLGDDWTRVAVVAPVEARIARAVARGADADDVRARVRNQPSDDEWLAWADHVIDNSGALETVTSAVSELVDAVLA